MKNYFLGLPAELKQIISLARVLSAQGQMPAYLVGGFVRDLILGVDNLDLDISVEGSGIVFAKKLAERLKSKIVIHERFGTATVTCGCLRVDIASARKESYAYPGSLPQVNSGTLRDDLSRRDFTINAMAVSLAAQDEFKLIDFFGGLRDLHSKKIRVLHNLSFLDDPTRIFRAIRFEQRYNFKIEPYTLALLKVALGLGALTRPRCENIPKSARQCVSAERLRHELILMLKESSVIKELKRLKELKVLEALGGDFRPAKLDLALLASLARQVKWFNQCHPGRRKLDVWLVYFMGLVDASSARDITRISALLNLHKGEEKRVLSLKLCGRKFIKDLSRKGISAAKIFALLEPLSYEAIIFLKAKYAGAVLNKHIADFLEIYNGMRIYASGVDLHGLGVFPGPAYQELFSKVLKAKLNGRVNSREEELILIRRLIKNLTPKKRSR